MDQITQRMEELKLHDKSKHIFTFTKSDGQGRDHAQKLVEKYLPGNILVIFDIWRRKKETLFKVPKD